MRYSLLALFSLSASAFAEDAYTIKLKTYPNVGQTVTIHETSKDSGSTRLLDGGRSGWLGAGQKVTTDSRWMATGELPPLTYRPLVVDAAYVRSHLTAPGYVVVDARAPDFYSGARPGGMPAHPHKPGHIAGAKSVPFMSVTTPEMTLASAETIAAQFKAAGVKRGDTVIAYCHVGQQASATLFAARTLGLKTLLYDGSFEEWSRLDGAVETSTSVRTR